MSMLNKIRLAWYFAETRYTRLLKMFGKEKDDSVIPRGMYCYIHDEDREAREPFVGFGYWTKTCKYYRSTSTTGGIACTYLGYYGHDLCLYDQCKICGCNEELDYLEEGVEE